MNEEETLGGPQNPLGDVLGGSQETPSEKLARSLWGDPEQRQNTAPQGLWERVKQRFTQLDQATGRGVGNFIGHTVQAAGSLAGAVGAEGVEGALKGAGQKVIDSNRQVYGESNPDDKVANFAENATEFAVGYAATAPLGVGKLVGGIGSKVARHMTEGALRGGLVDFVADPHGEQLAELAARAPVPVIKQLGEILSVDEDDSELVARLKRTGAGMIAGVAMDGLIAGARRLRAVRAASKGSAEAVEEIAKQDKVLSDIAEGKHTPEGAAVVARPNENGTWSLKTVEDDVKGVEVPDTPTFANRAEAEAQAETINVAVKERVAGAKGLTPEQATAVRDGVKKLIGARNTEEVQTLLNEGTHFNLAYYTQTPEQTRALIESVSGVFKEELDRAEAHTTVEAVFEKAQEILGGMTEEQAAGIMKEAIAKGGIKGTSARRLAADMVLRNLGEKIGRMFDVLDSRPQDMIAHEEARLALDNFFGLQKVLAGADSEYGRALRFLQERDTFDAAMKGKQVFKSEAKAASELAAKEAEKAAKEAAKPENTFTAGMKHREIKELTRMIQMADGKPRDLFAAGHAAAVMVKNPGKMSAAVEIFVNSLLSGPKTISTALFANAGTSLYEGLSRSLAGVLTGNRALAREGADLLWGHAAYLKDSFKGAAEAFRRGTSVLNPGETHYAISGLKGDIVRLPSRGLLAADEFTRVSNYRSFIRAKSLRHWRDQGLDGTMLVNAVENDLRAAFNKDGVATIPDALKFAELPTLSSPLGNQTVGGKLASLINAHPALKFVAPFIKTGTNIFRYTWQNTPVLNRFQSEAKEIFRAAARPGATQAEREAAAILHTKSAMAAGMFAFSAYQTMSGNLTGGGPSNPTQRKLWLEDHQPYSIKVGGKWVSYRRMEPVSAPLGLVADLIQAGTEIADDKTQTDVTDAGVAVAAALTSNFANKSYLAGLTKFFDAWAGGDPFSARQFVGGIATGFLMPQAVQQTSTDPYFRDAKSVVDMVVSRSPWSGNVSPKYNIYGEPIKRAEGYVNRSFNIWTVKDATPDRTSQELASLEQSFSLPPSTQLMGVKVNLQDREAFNNGSNVSPWDRMMELMREPKNGRQSLREKLTGLVNSDQWQNASAGSELYPGGKRYKMATAVIEEYKNRALGEVLREYPLLKDEIKNQKRLKAESMRSPQVVDEILKGR